MINTINCKNCGAVINLYAFGKYAKCSYCGSQQIIESNTFQNSWENAEYKYARDCPACRCEGSMKLNILHTRWKCLNCGYAFTVEALKDEIFWFCDGCDTFLNVQPGFDEGIGSWKCLQCGFVNDTTEDNIFE